MVLDSMVYLIECGHALPVMHAVSQWAKDGVDLSLIRYFAVKVCLSDGSFDCSRLAAELNRATIFR